jgi:hypothetical protein
MININVFIRDIVFIYNLNGIITKIVNFIGIFILSSFGFVNEEKHLSNILSELLIFINIIIYILSTNK